MFPRYSLTQYETEAAQLLFDRIIEAESDSLTDEQRGDMRKYLLSTWEVAAEAVMRPIHSREQMERRIAELHGLDRPMAGQWRSTLDD